MDAQSPLTHDQDQDLPKASRSHQVIMGVLSLGLVALVSVIGSSATIANIPIWYAGLNKPDFTPPNWVFGPAWTLLYALMAIAFWRILVLPKETTGKRAATFIYGVQLILNAAWSVVFFGMQNPAGGLAVIGLMIIAIVATLVQFYRLDRPAGLLLLPYLAWVLFASALNAGVWWLN